jgi:exosome complex component RRP45
VWALRVDVNVLNHEGNLVEAASVAALTALCHFHCPDVTIKGEEIIIHNPEERDPIPLSLHHYPVCVSYAVFNNGYV